MARKQGASIWRAIGIGAAVGAGGSMLVTLILTAAAAALLSREIIGIQAMDGLTAAILVVSAGCGGVLAAGVTGHHRLLTCMVTGGVYYLILLACTALFFDGIYAMMGITALVIAGGCGAAALLGLKAGKQNSRSLHYKNRNWKVVQNSQRGN